VLFFKNNSAFTSLTQKGFPPTGKEKQIGYSRLVLLFLVLWMRPSHGYTGSAFKNISGVYSTSAFKFYTAFYLNMVSAFVSYHTAFSSD
jgi:hypothetical protein